jgi:hypothetical protein
MKLPYSQDTQFGIGAVAVFLGFCAYFAWLSVADASMFDTQWVKTRPAATVPYQYITVPDADRACRQAGAQAKGSIHGCATLYNRDCAIYLPSDPPVWLVEHEERHCAGFTHD